MIKGLAQDHTVIGGEAGTGNRQAGSGTLVLISVPCCFSL